MTTEYTKIIDAIITKYKVDSFHVIDNYIDEDICESSEIKDVIYETKVEILNELITKLNLTDKEFLIKKIKKVRLLSFPIR